MVCPSCSEYVLYAVQIAVEIYAVIKPRIYANIDMEFERDTGNCLPLPAVVLGGFHVTQRKKGE